jgi:hypothetical protein
MFVPSVVFDVVRTIRNRAARIINNANLFVIAARALNGFARRFRDARTTPAASLYQIVLTLPEYKVFLARTIHGVQVFHHAPAFVCPTANASVNAERANAACTTRCIVQVNRKRAAFFVKLR